MIHASEASSSCLMHLRMGAGAMERPPETMTSSARPRTSTSPEARMIPMSAVMSQRWPHSSKKGWSPVR